MRKILLLPVVVAALLAGGASRVVQDQCGPFTDVTPGFCPFILEIYYLGVTVGTSATTFSPDEPLTRGQGAVFVAKGINQTLARSSRRAALGQWWTTQNALSLGLTTVDGGPFFCESDGADVWVSNNFNSTVSRVRASDGKLIETWTGAVGASGVVSAMGRIFIAGALGSLYMIDPTQPPGSVTTVASGLVNASTGLAFDGARFWTAGAGVSIITPGPSLPWSVTNVTAGFQSPYAVLFDGTNVWVTDQSAATILRLDSSGTVLQTVPIPGDPLVPTFDGANLWVPSENGAAVVVVQASTGVVLQTLSGNGLGTPIAAAYDGQRILVTSNEGALSLWRASDLSPIGFTDDGPATVPRCACSDGINFWIPLIQSNQLARF